MRKPTQTGGREATTRRISGEFALCVGEPTLRAPPGWRWFKLTDVARLESGHTPSRKHPEYWGGDIPWITLSDARAHDGGMIFDTIETTNELGIANSSARMLPAGTVCLSRTASIGYVIVTGRPMATSQDFVNWVCSDKLDPHFLRYLLIAERSSLPRFASGAVHSTIYFPEVKALHVCLPPLPEQKRIVAILDEAFEGIGIATANAEKNLANARELFETILEREFLRSAADIRELGAFSNINYGYTEKASFEDVGPKFLRITDIQDGSVDWETVPTCVIADDDFVKHKLADGDIVFARTGATTGKSFLVCKPPLAVAASYLIRLRVTEPSISPSYLAYFFRSKRYWSIIERGISGSAQGGFNASKLAEIEVPIPRADKQLRIVQRLDAVSAEVQELRNRTRHKIDCLSGLKQSILSRAFSGQLKAAKGLAA